MEYKPSKYGIYDRGQFLNNSNTVDEKIEIQEIDSHD
jgi:hypothetical protein